MHGKLGWSIVGILFLIITALVWVLFTVPAPAKESANTQQGQAPLHERVHVGVPASGATVGKTFSVSGEAPGNWYFEASFPVEVRDAGGNKIGQAVARAEGEWMTTEQVPFKAEVTLSSDYHGPATLVFLRDNPSDLPENDDSLEVPVILQ